MNATIKFIFISGNDAITEQTIVVENSEIQPCYGEELPLLGLDFDFCIENADSVSELAENIKDSYNDWCVDEGNSAMEWFGKCTSYVIYPEEQDIIDALVQAYYVEDKGYNTDIIIEFDGSVRTHNYYGSCDYRDSDIVCVYTISSQDKYSFVDMLRDGLTDAQKKYVRDNDMLTIWMTPSDDENDWEEFTIDDFDWSDTINDIEEKMNQELGELK